MKKIHVNPRLLLVFLLAVPGSQTFAQNSEKPHFTFANVSDSTQGLSAFSKFPAINNAGAVAFIASDSNNKPGVFRWQEGEIATMASESNGLLASFGDDVVINDTGIVAYDANLTAGINERVIRTTDGVRPKRLSTPTNKGSSVDSWARLPSMPREQLHFSPSDKIVLSLSSREMASRSRC